MSAHAHAAHAAETTPRARGLTGLLVLLALVAAWLVNHLWAPTPLAPKQGFDALTGFYVATQGTERAIELGFLPFKLKEADQKILALALGLLLGVLASSLFGLYFLGAVTSFSEKDEGPRLFDVVLTGLVVAGGSKPLHDLIDKIEKSSSSTQSAAQAETP